MSVARWGHQEEAFNYCRTRKTALLYMGMGTGKSKIVVDLIPEWDLKFTVIVCPLSVIPAWRLQFETHASDTAKYDLLLLYKGGVKTKHKKLQQAYERAAATGRRLIVVINYESVWREPIGTWLLRKAPDCVVCDEVHKISSPGGKVARYMGRMHRVAEYRLGLSGTPIANSPMGAYGIFRFLDQDIFGKSFTRFRSRYAIMGGFEGREVIGYQNEGLFNSKFYS